jgi:hypothetical protein
VKSWKVYLLKPANVSDLDRWPEYHQWLLMKLERLRTIFGPRIKSLSLPAGSS